MEYKKINHFYNVVVNFSIVHEFPLFVYDLMVNYCSQCNRIFTYIDSLSYSQLSDIIKQDDEHVLMINTLRKYALDKVGKELKYVLSDIPKLQKEVIEMQILSRIPMIFHMTQIAKSSRLKISDF